MNIPDLSKPLLAIDTATPSCSVAVRVNQRIIARADHSVAKHTRVILPMIKDCLDEAQLAMTDIAGIILSAGPGAFTGLRVGASVASGLAYASNIPIGKLSSLALVAATSGKTGIVLPLLDARIEHCYAGLYHCFDNQIEVLAPDTLCAPDELPEDWQTRAQCAVGSGLIYRDKMHFATAKLLPDTVPLAEKAFSCLSAVCWQSAQTPIELYYLRNEITS